MELLIANGGDVDPSYNDYIAVSHDGTQWNYISKAEIDVITSTRTRSNPKLNKGRTHKARIDIKFGDCLDFDVQDLSVGTGTGQWTASDVNGSQAGLENVKSTILGWL